MFKAIGKLFQKVKEGLSKTRQVIGGALPEADLPPSGDPLLQGNPAPPPPPVTPPGSVGLF